MKGNQSRKGKGILDCENMRGRDKEVEKKVKQQENTFTIYPTKNRISKNRKYDKTIFSTFKKPTSSLNVSISAFSLLITREGSRSSFTVARFFIKDTLCANLE